MILLLGVIRCRARRWSFHRLCGLFQRWNGGRQLQLLPIQVLGEGVIDMIDCHGKIRWSRAGITELPHLPSPQSGGTERTCIRFNWEFIFRVLFFGGDGERQLEVGALFALGASRRPPLQVVILDKNVDMTSPWRADQQVAVAMRANYPAAARHFYSDPVKRRAINYNGPCRFNAAACKHLPRPTDTLPHFTLLSQLPPWSKRIIYKWNNTLVQSET